MDKSVETKKTTVNDGDSRLFYSAGLVIGVVVFVTSLLIAMQHQLTGFQLSVFHFFNNWHDGFTTPALWITQGFGSGYAIAGALLIPLIFQRFRLAWRFFAAIAATGVTMEVAKIIAKEPRPAALLGSGNFHERAIETGLNSFPSGHVAIATAIALTLWLILPRAWRWVSIVWIIVIAVSRLYLGVHTLNDVIGGITIGLIVACVIYLLPKAIARPLRLADSSREYLLKKGR